MWWELGNEGRGRGNGGWGRGNGGWGRGNGGKVERERGQQGTREERVPRYKVEYHQVPHWRQIQGAPGWPHGATVRVEEASGMVGARRGQGF